MKKLPFLLLTGMLLPAVTYAMSLQEFTTGITKFINSSVIPFILGIGFLFFAINVVRYFVAGSNNEQGREKAKSLAIYSVLGFVTILVFWGVINMLVQSIGLGGQTAPTPDYIDGSSQGSLNTNGGASGSNTTGGAGNNTGGSNTSGGGAGASIPGGSNTNDPCATGATFDTNGRPCGIY